ncbi:hypothetical protein EON63_08510 [archaeon]|nr:MAG: hypothetical protein EON63_08510 [archaeon]
MHHASYTIYHTCNRGGVQDAGSERRVFGWYGDHHFTHTYPYPYLYLYSYPDSSGGKLNLMGSGTMIHSIFGFCDVRQFTDTTECLQEEVMLFVNRIAHILHSIVVQVSMEMVMDMGIWYV